MPLMSQDITGITSTQTVTQDAQGRLTPAIRVSFKVKGQGPFFVELPKDGFTADLADKAIQAYATELCKLADKYPGA